MNKTLITIAAALVILGCNAEAQTHQNNSPVNSARVILWKADGCDTDNAMATFAFYANKTDVSPLWQETQTNADQNDYNLIGNASGGVPSDVFADGQAKWLELACNGGANGSSRIFLTAVPYAISAVDSTNLGGRPAADYALVSQLGSNPSSGALNNEISRAQRVETQLAQQITTEVSAHQSAISAIQLNEVATASQVASLSAAIVTLQSQIAALQASNTALAAQVAAMTGTQSAATEQPDVHRSSTAQIQSLTTGAVAIPAAITSASASKAADRTPRTGRASRIAANVP